MSGSIPPDGSGTRLATGPHTKQEVGGPRTRAREAAASDLPRYRTRDRSVEQLDEPKRSELFEFWRESAAQRVAVHLEGVETVEAEQAATRGGAVRGRDITTTACPSTTTAGPSTTIARPSTTTAAPRWRDGAGHSSFPHLEVLQIAERAHLRRITRRVPK